MFLDLENMNNKIGLYIHVPFCLSKCPYCDFYSERYSRTLAERYKQAVVRNIDYYGGYFDTVYFGGGTPILLAEEISEILGKIKRTDDAEITVEANPCACDRQRLELLFESGVNRLSIGVQSLNERELAFLGRRHSPQQAEKAISCSHSIGFRNISADLMLGLEGQTKESVLYSIQRLAELPLTHISAYLLKVEDGTPFAERTLTLPDEEQSAELYIFAAEQLEKHGFMQYEISNFARSGFESRHNLHYWRCEEYLGIGPAAHSYYCGKRFCTGRDLNAFLSSEYQQTTVTDDDPGEFDEFAMLALRLTEGLKFSNCSRFGVDVNILKERCKKIPEKYVNITNEGICLTKEGFLVSNAVIGVILGY